MAKSVRELLKEANQEVLDQYIADLGGEKSIFNLKVMKEIMNKSFGEANNQIIQPTTETIIDYFINWGYSRDYIYAENTANLKRMLDNSRIGYTVLIHFPELVITNSKKLSHNIKDLYVKFDVGIDGKMNSGLSGIRTSLTRDECASHYMHSHLPTFDLMNMRFMHFCTGEGEINQVIYLLGSNFDEVNFTLFCLHLKNYVIWESLEGNPYRRMVDIGLNGGTRTTITQDRIDKVVSILKSTLFNDPKLSVFDLFKFTISDSSIIATPTDEFEKWAADYIMKVDHKEIDKYKADNTWLLCRKDEVGNSYPIGGPRNTTRIAHQTTPILKFKGEDKFFTVLNQENEIKATKYLRPEITQKLCWSLTREFTKIALNSKGIEEQESAPVSFSEVAEPDLFPL